jgi:hypothetical protein
VFPGSGSSEWLGEGKRGREIGDTREMGKNCCRALTGAVKRVFGGDLMVFDMQVAFFESPESPDRSNRGGEWRRWGRRRRDERDFRSNLLISALLLTANTATKEWY